MLGNCVKGMLVINCEKILIIMNFDEFCGLDEIWFILVFLLLFWLICEIIMLLFFCMVIVIFFCVIDEWLVINVVFSICSVC